MARRSHLIFIRAKKQLSTYTRFALHWDTEIRCCHFCRHRLNSHLTTPHRRKPVSSCVSRPDLVPVSSSSFTFLREGITLLQSRQDGVVGMATVQKLTTNDNRLSINQAYNPLIEMNAFFTKFINTHLLSHKFSGFRLIVDKMHSSISLNSLNYSLTRSRIWTVIY